MTSAGQKAAGQVCSAAGAEGRDAAAKGGGQVVAAAPTAGVPDALPLPVVPTLPVVPALPVVPSLLGGRPRCAQPVVPTIALQTARVELSSGVTSIVHRVLT